MVTTPISSSATASGISGLGRLIGKTIVPGGGGSDVKFAVVNASTVASGTQDFTSSGFGTPKGAIFIMNGVTADGLNATGYYGIGAWDTSTTSWATGISDEDAVANADTYRRSSSASSRVVYIPEIDNTTWAEADYSTTVTDGVRITWITSPGAGFYITCILIGGDDASVAVGSFQANASTTPKTVTTNIDQKLIFLSSVGNTLEETTTSATGHYEYVHGWASSTGPVTMGPGIFFNDGAATGDPRGGYYDTHCGFFWANIRYQAESYTTTSFDFTSGGGAHAAVWWFYIAIDTADLGIYNDVADTPTSTGDWSRTGYGFTPQFVFGTMIGEGTTAGKNTENLQTTDADGVACNSTFASDGTTEFCYGCSTEDAAATMNSNSVGTQSGVFLQYDDTAATKHTEGTVSSFDGDGVTFNFTTATAARYVNFFAVEQGGSGSTGAIGVAAVSVLGPFKAVLANAIASGVAAIQRLHLKTLVPKTDVRFAVINATSPAATGNQTYTSAGFGEVKGYLIYMSGVPSGEVATHGFIGRGACDLTNTYAYGASAEDNRGPPNANTQHINSQTSGRVIFIPNNSGGKFAEARHVGANSPGASNGITLNWVTTPGAGYDVTIVLMGGPHMDVGVGSFTTNGDLTEKTVTTNIDQKILIFDSPFTASLEQTTDSVNAYHCWGFAKAETTRFNAGVGAFFTSLSRSGDVAGDPRGGFTDNASLSSYWTTNSYAVTSNDATSFGITQVDGGGPIAMNSYYVAIDTKDAPIWNDSFDTPSSTGNQTRTGAGFQPQIILGFMMGETTSASINTPALEDTGTDDDGVACVSFFGSDGTNDFCIGYSNEDGVEPTNVNSVASQSAVLLQYDDSATTKHVEATVSSFDSDGVTFNFTTATGDHYVSYLAVGQGREGAVGVPGFVRFVAKQIKVVATGVARMTIFLIQISVKPFQGGGGGGRAGAGSRWTRRVSAWRRRR